MKPPLAHRRRKTRGGQVLFELLTALFIFGLVAFSLVMVLDSAFDAAKERNEIEAAMRGMENQMTLLHAGPVAPSDKDLPDDKSGITYHLTLQPEQMLDQKKQPVLGIFRATITAKWISEGTQEERDISELIYQP